MHKSIIKYLIVTVLTLLIISFLYKGEEISKAIDSIKFDDKSDIEHYDNELKIKISTYNSNQVKIIKKYKKKINDCVHTAFENARSGATVFSDNLRDIPYLLKLSFYFTCDRLKKESSFKEEIGEKISCHITGHINNAFKESESLMRACYRELSRNHTKLKLELDKILENRPEYKGIKMRLDSLEETLEKIQCETSKNSMQLMMIISFEGIIIKDTCRIILKTFKPFIEKISVSLTASIADGPMPLCDFVGAILTFLSLYDIYYIIIEVPQTVKSNLISELNNQENTFIREVDVELSALLEKFKQ